MTIHPGGFVARPCDSACPENTNTTIYRCLRCPNPAWQPAPDIVVQDLVIDGNPQGTLEIPAWRHGERASDPELESYRERIAAALDVPPELLVIAIDHEPLDPYARRIDGSATAAAPEAAVRGEAFARRVATGGPCAPIDPMYELIRRHSTGALARYVYGEDGDYWPDAQVVTFGEDD